MNGFPLGSCLIKDWLSKLAPQNDVDKLAHVTSVVPFRLT